MKTYLHFLYINLFMIINCFGQGDYDKLKINDLDYFESRGLNVMVFNGHYNGLFGDEKTSGIEMIHHGVRTVTNGDVRLNPTPAQWDPIPEFKDRKVDKEKNVIEVYLSYPEYNFNYIIHSEPAGEGFNVSVMLEDPLPKELEGHAGFNLEFLPSAYFEKSYIADGRTGIFPLYPAGPMQVTGKGNPEPLPLASGTVMVFAPEDPQRRITIKSERGNLSLYDGRNQAQNGWFVVRTLIPSGKTGKVIEWNINANTIPDWVRPPMIAYSQLGYHPDQNKTAVFEFDCNDKSPSSATLIKINDDGTHTNKYKAELKKWGKYLRFDYSLFDFTDVKGNGLYAIEYNGITTAPFRIAEDIYQNAWYPTLDVYLNVAMDHMFVNEAYRVWHGTSHIDDALQAPVNHEHFDLYAQGSTTDTRYKPFEHIPGLNIGGWYDAGDFDIRTQTQYGAVSALVQLWEDFKPTRDETYIDEKTKYVDMHHPDGKPDVLQQIEHGTLVLIAQFRAVGHAIPGIIEAHLSQYTHLGDASTKTDNLIYDPDLDSLETDCGRSGTFDDRWAFTSKSTSLNYGSIAALAAASRVLKGFNDSLAAECLTTAKKVWSEEHAHEPVIFKHGNTTGGQLDAEELNAAVELLKTTKDTIYSRRVDQLLLKMEKQFMFNASVFAMAIPYMNKSYHDKLEKLVKEYSENMSNFKNQNPFGVFISTGGWAGSGGVIGMALTNYRLHKFFPELIDRENVLRGLNYIYGCHPGSNISLVSGVGTISKKVAYGNNRADFTFIAGGIVPGVMVIKPDFPENKEDWPFFWGENEYVINLAPNYIYLVHAVDDLLNGNTKL